ncbi:protein of unknown function [Vibrio tapetis subsp. tapetis]|uniref:Uncharacterized protein n=1 Tax=Vibrio tapetis subsp. tapetis TaxID=1671868 RepID=A0A2N8ZND6_9VIBR|nr:protein of unknown function [Vibrio tapetis subsp. tapetis]
MFPGGLMTKVERQHMGAFDGAGDVS